MRGTVRRGAVFGKLAATRSLAEFDQLEAVQAERRRLPAADRRVDEIRAAPEDEWCDGRLLQQQRFRALKQLESLRGVRRAFRLRD
jgi:hypothetical protein